MPNKQGKGKIETCHWSWNPVKGRCGFAQEGEACEYCWAERLYQRNLPFMDPELRLDEKELLWSPSEPCRIAVCYSTDLFHPLVDREWIKKILETVRANPQNTYQFLTKCPSYYRSRSFVGHFPDNAWVGTTIDGERNSSGLHDLASPLIRAGLKYIFFEPLLRYPHYLLAGRHNFRSWDSIRWIVVGADSRPGAVAPPVEWAECLVKFARSEGIAVYVKDNYPGYPDRPKEFPE